MWAQLISAQLKAGHEDDLAKLADLLEASEQADSGIVRELVMRDQQDPSRIYVLAVFESEDKARIREADPRRHDSLNRLREHMGQMLAGVPEFVDLSVVSELFA